MPTVESTSHRTAMANMRIAYITEPAERRMQTQTASEQLRFALAESKADRQTPCRPLLGAENNFDLCKYLIGI